MESRDLAERLKQAVRAYVDLSAGLLPARFSLRAGHGARIDIDRAPACLSAERAELVHRVLPEKVEAVQARAKQFAVGRFQFLGYPPVHLERPLRYEADPFTGGQWPRRHGLMLDYRSTDVGDPKWIWELNRLQHVPLLLAASRLAEDDRYVGAAVADLEAWLAQTAPGRGISWSNGYEPALRAISMALSLDALRGLDIGASALAADLLHSLDRHVAWIRRYPSLHSSANNHRVGELTGLIVTAVLAPELTLDALLPAWLDELHQRTDEQFAADGTHREQAFGYTVFTAELVLLVVGALPSSGRTVPAWLYDVLRRVAQALATQLGAEHPEPRYGDCDDGGPTLLGAPWGRSGRSLLAGLRYALGERSPERLAHLEPSTLWLLGDPSVSTPAIDADAGSAWMPDLGVVLLRAGRTAVSFDLGPLGFGRLAAHGHADALHVTVSHGGSLVIGDPGTGSYFGNRAVRDAFRGTGYHATVMVDLLDQAQATGPFLWSSAPTVRDCGVDLAGRVATGSHDGYGRLAHPVSHRRTILILDEGLVVLRDVLEGDGLHAYSQRWPLPPGAAVQANEPGRFHVQVGELALLLVTVCSAACQAFCREGSVHPLEGWWSDRLESICPAPLIGYDASARSGAEFVTLLALAHDPVSLLDTRLIVSEDSDARIVHNGTEWRVCFSKRGAHESHRPTAQPVGAWS